MRLLSYFHIGDRRIELLQGDLTNLPVDQQVDLLVISAFPNDYTPTPTSLIGALHAKGLSVADLAVDKEEDLRVGFSCWVSKELASSVPGLGFQRILCFEPLVRGEPPEVVGDIYRALVPILGQYQGIKSVAMPIVAAGDQRYSVESILTPLLEATIHWLEEGLPLDLVKIVVRSQPNANRAHRVFDAEKRSYERKLRTDSPKNIPIIPSGRNDFDVFISYAHEDTEQMQEFEAELLRLAPHLRVFLDRKSIDIGRPWQPEIFESLDRCRKVVAFFSPHYLRSRVCKEEFNIAWVRSRESNEEILFPAYLFTAQLPTYMRYRSYYDCREGDSDKIREAARRLLDDLGLLPESRQ